jgi:hypothetical protein
MSTDFNAFATNRNGIAFRSGWVRANRTVVHILPANRPQIRLVASYRRAYAVNRVGIRGGSWRIVAGSQTIRNKYQHGNEHAQPAADRFRRVAIAIARMRTTSATYFFLCCRSRCCTKNVTPTA